MRTIPRNVDGRIKVGPYTLKNLAILIPSELILLILFIKNPTSVGVSVFIILMGGIALALAEINNKETGLHLGMAFLKYTLEGAKIYERSCENVLTHERLINNEKVREIKENKSKRINSDTDKEH